MGGGEGRQELGSKGVGNSMEEGRKEGSKHVSYFSGTQKKIMQRCIILIFANYRNSRNR